jgi:hypothetical protein
MIAQGIPLPDLPARLDEHGKVIRIGGYAHIGQFIVKEAEACGHLSLHGIFHLHLVFPVRCIDQQGAAVLKGAPFRFEDQGPVPDGNPVPAILPEELPLQAGLRIRSPLFTPSGTLNQ